MQIRISVTTIILSSVISLVQAAEIKPFTQDTFNNLSKAGKPIVMHIHATWCGTCKEQQSVIEKIIKQPTYQEVTVLKVDFDNQKNVVKQYKATMQSTLIAYKAGKETSRTVGDASTAGMEDVFKKAVY